MNDSTPQVDTEKFKDLAKLRVVLRVPATADVEVQRDVTYRGRGAEALGIDVYRARDAKGPLPAVIFIAGYSDLATQKLFGLRLKDMGTYVSWAELAATSGLVGITYAAAAPPEDARAVVRFVREHAADLNVDPMRIGIWAASGNGPTALSLLSSSGVALRFAVMCNTYMLDLGGDSTVSTMSARFGFSEPNAGKTIADLDASTPLFVVRSGQDAAPGLNGTLDRFVAAALESNLPITVVNLPQAPHSFDTFHDSDESREVINRILAFMRAAASS